MRRAFTLIEVLLALVITGLVVTLAYGTAQAGFDTQARLTEYRVMGESDAVVRSLLSDALRHAVDGVRGGEAVFDLTDRSLSDGTPNDSLRFTTRGVVPPLGSSGSWSVEVWSAGGALHLSAYPETNAPGELAPVQAQLTGVRGLDVQLLGRGMAAVWRDGWAERDVAPDAISFAVVRDGSRAERGVGGGTIGTRVSGTSVSGTSVSGTSVSGTSVSGTRVTSERTVVRRGLERAP